MSKQDGGDTIRSYDPSEASSDIGFYKTMFRLYWNTRKICMPAVVTNKQDEDGLLTVQPMADFSKTVQGGREDVKRSEVRVWPMQFRHGGYKVSCPIFVGDTGYIIAGDRDCTDAIKANCNVLEKDYDSMEKSPNKETQQLKEFGTNEWEYGFFVPSSWEIPDSEDEFKEKFFIGNVLKDDEKQAYITWDMEGNVVVKGGKEIKLDSPKVVVEHDLEIKEDIILQDPPDESMRNSVSSILFGFTEQADVPIRKDDGEKKHVEYAHVGKVECGKGVVANPRDDDNVDLDSICIKDLEAEADVSDGDSTDLKLTAERTEGGIDSPSKWKIRLEGTVHGGGGGEPGPPGPPGPEGPPGPQGPEGPSPTLPKFVTSWAIVEQGSSAAIEVTFDDNGKTSSITIPLTSASDSNVEFKKVNNGLQIGVYYT